MVSYFVCDSHFHDMMVWLVVYVNSVLFGTSHAIFRMDRLYVSFPIRITDDDDGKVRGVSEGGNVSVPRLLVV